MRIRGRNRIIISLFFKFLVIVVIIFFYIKLFIPQNTYNVNARTETIRIEVANDSYQKIPLPSATYTDGFFSEEINEHTGSFKPHPRTIMTISRYSKEKLRISVEKGKTEKNENEAGMKEDNIQLGTGIFFNEKDEIDSKITTGNFIDFLIPMDSFSKRIIIPFRGKVELGINPFASVPQAGSNILTGGEVQIISNDFFRKSYYVGETYSLNPGDQIRLEKEPDSLADSYGIVMADKDSSTLTVNYKSLAAQARIFTPGPVDNQQGYKLKESIFSRFSNDNFFIGVAWFAGIIILFAELLELKNEADIFITNNILKRRSKKKKKSKS
ncbi:hypothetical protein GCM10023115_40020 [Pontixanthobacter gangjinensis]|uniref:Uncharacterized protein n=1 Tax=Christiangramia aestuarii TaxID=1028746 RepID=A0A7K1LSL6_9FLAO|nr:hypothetical protein [Christiangramia aestuarii]MUP43611.1 hypothetical protein [Christiangramia aestuarii]